MYVEFLRRYKLCVDMSMNMSLCVNALIHSRNVACIDEYDSDTFFLLDICAIVASSRGTEIQN